MAEFEIRASGVSTKGNTLTGYAAMYNSPSGDLGGFTETIAPGAFDKSLASGRNVRALYEHDHQKLLGTTAAGTLRLSSDSIGLRFELDLPNTSYANDLRSLVQRGDVAGCSFGFTTVRDSWQGERRTLHEVKIGEITITSIPAYPETSCALRSLAASKRADGRVAAIKYLETL